tara:strand:+ start:5297 stop:11854 length:6558 start_codon:yes stop_codon:yes gene_type:complete
MPIPENIKREVDLFRSEDQGVRNWSDERIYRYLKRDNPNLSWAEADAKYTKKKKADTSPTFVNAFQSWFDLGIDENSAEFFKAGYNNSLTGLAEQAITGKPRYDLSEYNPTVLEDIGSMITSFVMPLDILALGTGAGAGSLALKGFGVQTAKEVAKFKGKQSLKNALIESGVRQAATLGTYEGAMGGLLAHTNDENVMSGIAGGVMHGGILGGLAGAAGGGMGYANAHLLNKYSKARKIATEAGKEASKALSFQEKVLLASTNPLGQVVAESGIFTAGDMATQIAKGEDVRWRDIGVSFVADLGLFGITKGMHKAFTKSDEYYNLLKEAEKKKHGVNDEGKTKTAEVIDKREAELREEAKIDREQGREDDAIAKLEIADELARSRTGADAQYLKIQDELTKAKSRTKNLIDDHNNGITTQSVERAELIIGNVNEQIGVIAKLIEHATDPVNPMYEGLLGQFRAHEANLLKLAERWKKDRIDSVVKKGAWKEPRILEENILRDEKGKPKLDKDGNTIELADIDHLDLTKPQDRAEATRLLKLEKDEIVQKKREEITPLGSETEAVKILDNNKFRDKDWSREVTDKTMLKDVKARVEGTDKKKGLADVDASIVEDTGGFESGTDKSIKYNNSKNIVRHFIQNVFPIQIGKTVRKGAFVGNPAAKASRLNTFAKWMAEHGKEIKEVTNADYQNYLAQHPSHVTELQQLREFLQTNQISKKTFNLTQSETKGFARKYIGESPEGVTLDAHSIGKNSITFVQPKNNKSITKYISTKLKNILTKLRKNNKKISPEINQTFLTKDGKIINNNLLNAFTEKIFGSKKQKDKARLFRDSLTGWASEKYGSTSPEVEVLIQEVLGDTANVNTINKAYVNKEAQKAQATKLVKSFIAEINKGGKKAKGKAFYSTLEISKGLKKIGKKDVIISIQQGIKNKKPFYKDIVIDNKTAEGMARYLIETSPRLNEIASSTEGLSFKYQLENTSNSLGIEVSQLKAQINHFKKLYPELVIQLKNSLGKFQGENVLGRITGHLIEIAQGKAKIDTIPHEVSHHVVDVLRAFGDKNSKKIIKDGERMFKDVDRNKSPEENMVQAIGEYVAGNMKNKTMIGKVKNFLKRFWSHLKHKFNVHNQADVTRILGEKVLKGDLPEQNLKDITTKYQTSKDSPEVRKQIKDISNRIHRGDKLDQTVKKADFKGWKEARIDIFGSEKYSTTDPNLTLDKMQRYEEYLTNHPANGGTNRSAENIARKIQDVNDKYHINPEVSKATLKLMGVTDGLYENASPETAKAYESMIRNDYDAPPVKHTNYTDDLILRSRDKTTKHPWMYRYGRAVMPVWLVLQNYGGKAGKRISQRLLNHEWAEHVIYKGPGDNVIRAIKKNLGRKKSKEAALLFDKERADRLYKEGGMTESQKQFYRNVYGDETAGIKKDKNSIEYKSHQAWENYRKDIWDKLEKALLKHETPESAKTIIAEMKKIEVDNYMTRALTSKALKYLTKDSNYMKSLVDKQVKKIASKLAKENTKTDIEAKLLKEKYLDPKSKEGEILRSEIAEEMYNVYKYGYGHAKNPHLIPRKGLMKEFVDITNDKGQLETIKVYEDSMEGTAGMYVRRMSKHIANIAYFPEWVGTGSKHKIHRGTQSDIVKIAGEGGIASYANLAVERQLGYDRNHRESLAEPLYKAGGTIASVSAAIGLSSPLSGLKNLSIGIPRAIGVHGFWRTMSGIKHAMNATAWHEARKKGYLEYGAKNLELDDIKLGEKLTMRKLFSFNFMTQTENLNRIISSHAGQLYFTEVSAKLRGEKGMFKMGTNKKRMKRLMEEVWHLSEDEISFIENTKDFTTADAKKKYAEIQNKVGHFSHVTAQGGTSTVMLPLWMSSREAKPLTLFQRMAMSTTIDTYRNFVKPIAEFGNVAPLVRAAVAHSVSGAALFFVYKELFGKEPPTGSKLSQEDSFDKIMLNLWRSEFFGLAGEVLPINPYERQLGVPIAQPVIIRNLTEALNEYTKWNAGGQSASQAIKNWTKKSVVVASQLETLYKTSKSPYYKDFNNMRSMVRKFKEERGMPMYSGDGYVSRRQPYYHDLKDAMMFGSEEDIAKSYWAAIDFIVSDMEKVDPYTTPRKRYKDARRAVKSVITHYAPLNISDETTGTSKSLEKQFFDWLTPENEKLAKKIDKIYKYKLREIKKIMRNPKWKDKYFVYPNEKV